MSPAVDFSRYQTQGNGAAVPTPPESQNLDRETTTPARPRYCPPSCTNGGAGTCPRCYTNTGEGCNHGPLCHECAVAWQDLKETWPVAYLQQIVWQQEHTERERLRASGAHVHHAPTVRGHQYLVHRLPNWRPIRWAVAQGNRYLSRSGSSWRLVIRYRCPIAGQKYGYGGALRQEHARAVSLYLRQERRPCCR